MPNPSEMSDTIDVKVPVMYVRWKANVKKKSDKYIYSSCFVFQGKEWCFWYYYYNSKHQLGLNSKNKDTPHAPFCASVYVESNETGWNMPKLSEAQIFDCYLNGFPICIKPESAVLKSDPHFRQKGELRFLVILKADDVLTENGSEVLQYNRSLERIVQETSGASTSSSVPTVLNISNYPCLRSLSEDLSKLLLDKDSEPDMEFRCEEHTIKAHRLIVSARSPVIASMLARDMVENKTGVVNIKDIEPDTLKRFLRYLYTGQLEELNFDNAMKLYEVGDQYAVRGLAKKCSTFLMREISVDKACEVLAVADAHSDSDLVDKVINYMVENRVPLVYDRWSDFCDEHSKLANKVLNHGWKMVMK